MQTQTVVELAVLSEFLSPEDLTRIIGLECERSWQRGQQRRPGAGLEALHCWILGSGLPRSAPLDDHVRGLLGRLAPAHEGAIRSLGSQANAYFSCILYADSMPALVFPADVIQGIARLGAVLDLDVYLSRGEEQGPIESHIEAPGPST